MSMTALSACAGKNVPASSTYTGSLAPQLIKGTARIVAMRSLGLFTVRVAMIAGTLQPKPSISGMKDCPCRPKACRILSVRKAALDM